MPRHNSNPDDEMLISVAEEWLATIRNPRTQRSYRRATEVLFESMAPIEPFPRPITSTDLQTFKALLVEDYKPATVNQRIVAVSSFVRWLVAEGRLPDSILDALPKRVSLKHQMVHAETTPQQAMRLCRMSNFTGPHRDRNYAAVRLIWETGCTVDELLNIRCGDLQGSSLIVGHRLVHVEADLRHRLADLADGQAGDARLLRGARSCTLAERVLRRALVSASEHAGIEGARLSGLRRAHAVHRYDLGERVKDIAADLGMAEFSTYRSLRGLPTGTDGENYHP